MIFDDNGFCIVKKPKNLWKIFYDKIKYKR